MFYGEHPPPVIKRRTAVLRNIVLSIDIVKICGAAIASKLVRTVFSMVNKIDTKFRPSLGNTTVCALLMSKSNSGVPCPQLYVSEQLFRDVKAAASKRNNDLRVAREDAAANNDVAVESEDESDDE